MRSWLGASWLRLRREGTGPRDPGGRGAPIAHVRGDLAVSRFRPGRRKDDHPDGDEPYDDHGYPGDPYDEGPYRDDPYRDGYAAPDDTDPGGRAHDDGQSDAGPGPARPGGPHEGGRPHGPRVRKDPDVRQPTSAVSTGGLAGP